jgi:hypothetical protein
MPTDIRQIQEMNAKIIEQQDRAIELLDVKDQHLKGWQRRFKEMTEQWIKETNEHREEVAALQAERDAALKAKDELGSLLSVMADASNALMAKYEQLQGKLADAEQSRDAWFHKWERMAAIARAAQQESK